MARLYYNQNTETVVDVSAGDAADGTTSYYVDMREHSRISANYAVAGSGSVTITVEGTTEDAKDTTDAANKTFVDISSTLLGATNVTATGTTSDSAGIAGCYTFLKYKVVVASSNTDTAYSIKINKTGS